PPEDSGKQLTKAEIEVLKRWVAEGGKYARHWSYVKPIRHPPPQPPENFAQWPRNEIDHFTLRAMLKSGLQPAPSADRYVLIRRVALDVTGLPPTPAEVAQFLADKEDGAVARMVDRMLAKPTYGEHWARMWLDLARYADSAGYADDPPRTIWPYRDWVIRAINNDMPFNQFTIEQLAGDLLDNATDDQLVATAFHRNTLTNNEGGTNDEEFRNVAIVDRVNTTMAVWMGTTINCAQCHNHKYDPISQREFFRLFAIFNNTSDADRRDESPLVSLYTEKQLADRDAWTKELAALDVELATLTPDLAKSLSTWQRQFAADLRWRAAEKPSFASKQGAAAKQLDDGSLLVIQTADKDTYTIKVPLAALAAEKPELSIAALRVETLPDEALPNKGSGNGGGNFVVTRVRAALRPPQAAAPVARFVRIELPGAKKMLSLAEVQVLSNGENVATQGKATQSSTDFAGPAKLAIDGNTNGDYNNAKSTTHTAITDNPWWEVDLQADRPVELIKIWNRTDNKLHTRLNSFRIAVLNEKREPLWEQTVVESPNPSAAFQIATVKPIAFQSAVADFAQPSFPASDVLNDKADTGWAVGGSTNTPHELTLLAGKPVSAPADWILTVTIEHNSKHLKATVGRFRLSVSDDARAGAFATTPASVLAVVRKPVAERSEAETKSLTTHYLSQVAPALKTERSRKAVLTKQLAALKPGSSAPIMRELPADKRRSTRIQRRGNFLELGDEVQPGVPSAFHPLDADAAANRLGLARWLVSEQNPLTARVIANRYWESIFGRGLVVSSEEFGSQGDLPSHPELIDWLATELVRLKWDTKGLVRLLVTSATYQQSSRVDPQKSEIDPANRFLARGPRFRLSAEMIRDQALFTGGLLSEKMYGAPVRPPQPLIGLSAAFGGGIDWKTSDGEDRYRRGLYTTWRRSNPYPSLAAFDAPNREVCTIRRDRTNTPLQALVTLNDPVYVEAAQALARRLTKDKGDVPQRIESAMMICLSRPPTAAETEQLAELVELASKKLATQPEAAKQLATVPLGAAPEGADVVELATWTVVGNVLMNLDEFLMKR
ncbi:MAG: DUF1553 domain-containing protein, partial [Pirellulaceae bacterium]|nr:DUF1553 domain-containing protein [Pirellulaceae bacterium]